MDRDAEIRRCRDGVNMLLDGLDEGTMRVIANFPEHREYMRTARTVGYYFAVGDNVPDDAGNAFADACANLANKLRDQGLLAR